MLNNLSVAVGQIVSVILKPIVGPFLAGNWETSGNNRVNEVCIRF